MPHRKVKNMPRSPKPVPALDAPPRQMAGVTLYDVAERAKVSGMTVSRVINGNGNVSEKTREKVMRAVDELGYKVNVNARAARIGTLRVGLLYSNPSAAFLSAFLVGAMGQCSRSGAELILEHCDDLKTQRKAIERLIAKGADGVLVPPPLCDSRSAMKHLKEIGMPTIAVATAKPSPQASAVRIDDYDGARAMTKYLLSKGHKDIAFIKGRSGAHACTAALPGLHRHHARGGPASAGRAYRPGHVHLSFRPAGGARTAGTNQPPDRHLRQQR
jgi:LacI family transcriptional regulator